MVCASQFSFPESFFQHLICLPVGEQQPFAKVPKYWRIGSSNRRFIEFQWQTVCSSKC